LQLIELDAGDAMTKQLCTPSSEWISEVFIQPSNAPAATDAKTRLMMAGIAQLCFQVATKVFPLVVEEASASKLRRQMPRHDTAPNPV